MYDFDLTRLFWLMFVVGIAAGFLLAIIFYLLWTYLPQVSISFV